MKLVSCLVIPVLFIISSCTALPTIQSDRSLKTTLCSKPFPSGQKQYVHSLVVTLPDGDASLMTGITTVSAEQRSVHVTVMTPEGLTLFAGRLQEDRVEILRRISFFSTATFAEGLLNDVRLIFLKPAAQLIEVGRTEQGSQVCRYRQIDKSVLDMVIDKHGDWELVQYGANSQPNRRVIARYSTSGVRSVGNDTPDSIKLIVTGHFHYTLDMQIIQSMDIESKPE
jgi:hypothetical protein